jgi:spore maturation protein CgeB
MRKKSLQDAKARALEASKECPEVEMRVMDKKGCKAVYTASDWIYRERVLEGYNTVVSYKGGKELHIPV